MFKGIKKWLKKILFDRDWVIFVDLKNVSMPSLDFKNFKPLLPPRNHFWADPFIISKDDKHYVFLEEFSWASNKGHISCLVLNAIGKTEQIKIILEKPYHLSYPFLFSERETLYMIPESSANKTIDLYECVNFPFEWKFKKTLIKNIDAVDTTIHFYEDRYWLFCGVKNDLSIELYDNLNIYYSDNLIDGHWIPHAKNPVVSDIKSARPAGKIYERAGALFRPSQIGKPFYGYGLSINKISELTAENYKEEIHSTILPNWNKNWGSIHTLNFSDKAMVTDGVLKRFKKIL